LSRRGAQLTLFCSPTAGPQGLRYQPDFITADEERDLIGRIRALPLAPFQFGAFEGKRRVAWFGWRYDYSQQKLEEAEAIPAWVKPLIAKIEALSDLRESSIRQVLCTEYEVGVGIGWHRDKPNFAEVLACRSHQLVNSGFVAKPAINGTASRSKHSRALSMLAGRGAARLGA
jgi:alkylated DNA repair dioxygenase AlkB